MAKPAKTCPKCNGLLIWNGSAMTCLACPYTTPVEPATSPSEKKLPTPRKSK